MQKDLKVKTSDNLALKDEINTYKRWFNGLKHFFTVKVIPPKQ